MAKNKDPRFYLDITRVDEDARMVYGYGTRGDIRDSYGTIIDLDSAVRCMDAYMEYPAVREMHQMSAAGRTVDYTADDAGIQLAVKVVDDQAWEKVKEQVYRGFSIGAKKEKQVGDTIYLSSITEFSLVDSPSNRGCGIDEFRIAGEVMEMEYETVQTTETAPLKRYVGEEISDVSSALSALREITWLLGFEQDEAMEGTHPEAEAQVAALKTAITALKMFIVSEIKEDTTPYTYTPGETTLLELSDRAADTFRITGADLAVLLTPPAEVERSGARNSAADLEMLQTMHDHAVALGAACGDTSRAAGSEDDVQRLATLDADVTRLAGEIDVVRAENVTLLAEADTLRARVAELEAQPADAKAALLAITREADVIRAAGKSRDADEVQRIEADESLDDVQRVAALVRVQQRNPIIIRN